MTRLEEYYRTKVASAAYDLFAVFARFEYAMKKGGIAGKITQMRHGKRLQQIYRETSSQVCKRRLKRPYILLLPLTIL